MATLSFATVTLWSDAASGVGPASVALRPASTSWNLVRLNGGGRVAQDTGSEGGGLQVAVSYVATPTEFANIATAIESCRGRVGSVSYPIGTSGATLTNCVLTSATLTRLEVLMCDGVAKYRAMAEFQFERLF
jgi:hypothetical protein